MCQVDGINGFISGDTKIKLFSKSSERLGKQVLISHIVSHLYQA